VAFIVILSTNNVFKSSFGMEKLHERTLEEVVKHPFELGKIADIPVGNHPLAISFSYPNVYVANYESNTLSVINADTNEWIKDIPVGRNPSGIVVNKDMFTTTVYVANFNSNYISVIDGTTNEWMKNIPVGEHPSFIAVDEQRNTIYVTNEDSDTVSVINGNTNEWIKDIPVGNYPQDIAIAIYAKPFEEPKHTVYVANYLSSTISVINGTTNEWIKDIPVGDGREDSPDDIAFNAWTNRIYVAKQLSNTVSVINGNTNEWIKNIPVGEHPQFIAFNADSNSLYVSNSFSDTISLIDGISDKVVAGFTFHINPPYSGYIKCDRLNAPTNEYFYVIPGTNCIAKPNTGFEFQSWAENLENNSSQLINGSRPSLPWDSFLELLRLKSSDEPEANIKITKFGTFTAKFKELPPPIPPEFWIQSYVLVGTVIAGLSIPSIVGWIKSKMDARKLNYYHKKIVSLYGDDGKLDENDIESLNRLRSSILDAYSKGKLNEKHYTYLVNNISMLYQEVFKKEIDSLNSLTNNEDKIKLLNKVHSDIEDAYSKEKVTEKHYNLLKEKMSEFENKNKDNERK
jgi:YVTN family beta-propeller protein